MTLAYLTAFAGLALLLPALVAAATDAEREQEIKTKLADNSYVADPVNGDAVVKKMVGLQNEINARGGCGPNLCFGIDGSKYITQYNYQRQIDFMAIIAGTIGSVFDNRPVPRFMAYEYGSRLKTISNPTENVETFFDRISANPGGPTARFTFLAPALLRCRNLMGKDLFINDANKIVLIGDGRTNFRLPGVAIREARKFQPPNANGNICAVTVKNPDLHFLKELTNDPRLVMNVEDTDEFINLLDEIVQGICDFF